MKLITKIFKKYEFVRDIPKEQRIKVHQLLDSWIDTDDYHTAFDIQYRIDKLVESFRTIYPIVREVKDS